MEDYTITTEHHDMSQNGNPLHDLWLPEHGISQQHMYPAPLHLDTQVIGQHRLGRQFSDGWDSAYSYNTTHSDPGPSGPSNSFLLSPSHHSTSPNTLGPYPFSPGTPTLPHFSPAGSSQSLSPFHSPSTPGSMNHTMIPSPDIDDMKRILKPENGDSDVRVSHSHHHAVVLTLFPFFIGSSRQVDCKGTTSVVP